MPEHLKPEKRRRLTVVVEDLDLGEMPEHPKPERRQLVSTSTLGIGVVLVLILFAIVNYFGWKYHQRFDWTSEKLYSLSEKSLNVLQQLDKDIEAVIFMSPADQLFGAVSELLSRYEAASPRLSVRQVDPEKNLAEAQSLVDKYEVSSLNVVVFDSGEDRRVVDASDLAEYDYSGLQFGQEPQMTGFNGEQMFTSAILELEESRKPKILFTSGHGELELDDFSPEGMSLARELLGKDNFELESWASLGQPAVPEGTDLVVVAGPTANFVEPEIRVLESYIDSGGRLLFMLDPTLAPAGGLVATGLEPLLEKYGVKIGNDIVVDPANPLPFFGADTIFVTSYAEHDITRPLSQAQLPVILGLARSVGMGAPIEELKVTELMMTSTEGWGETNLDELQRVELQDDDLAGPVPLAVAVEVITEEESPDPSDLAAEGLGIEDLPGAGDDEETAEGEEAAPAAGDLRLVVMGDSDFATNGQLQNMPNATLLANTLNWLVEREALVGIPPKKPEQVKLSLSQSQHARVSWLVLAVLPGLAVLLGFAVYWQRRR